MNVSLVAGIPQQDVMWRAKNAMQRKGYFYGTKIRTKVAAVGVDAINNELTDLCGKQLKLLPV
ncbi:unannotated protein [freshwater metagenome]|uniref:Unannotated protein n=1 Tax=freshwater metagenome TaxID=449393 RepID=A0A6J6NNX3_9ZZZZ